MATSPLNFPTFFFFFSLMEIPYAGLNHELILTGLAKSDSNVSAYTHTDTHTHTSCLSHTASHSAHQHTDSAVIILCWPFSLCLSLSFVFLICLCRNVFCRFIFFKLIFKCCLVCSALIYLDFEVIWDPSTVNSIKLQQTHTYRYHFSKYAWLFLSRSRNDSLGY